MDVESRDFLNLLGRFVVRVEGTNMRGGSGFFAGRGLVVTCAHVVAVPVGDGPKKTAQRARVTWLDGHAEGTVRAKPSEHDGQGLWGYPDLAVIALDDPLPDHPWIPMADRAPQFGQMLYAVGYSAVYERVPRLGVSSVEYEPPISFGDGEFVYQLKSGELAAGKSGGPLLDLQQGEVYGVVTTTRRENLPMGGLALPALAIREEFPEVWQANRTPSALDTEIWRLRAAVQHEYAPGAVLSRSEEKALLHAAKWSGLQPAALYWRSIHTDYGAPPGPLESMADVLREVADAPSPLDGPHPLLVFIQQVVDATPPHRSRELAGLVEAVANRLGVPPPPPRAARPSSPASRIAAISVHLDSRGPDSERYRLSVWKYPNVTEPPYAVLCDDQPLTLAQAQEQFRAVVPHVVGDLAGISDSLVIEFALPRAKLNAVAVDTWYLSQEWAPIGRQYPVVLRVLDRAPDSYFSWIARWRRLHEGRVNGPQATMDWVDCHRDVSPDRFYGWLQQQTTLSVLAFPFGMETASRRQVLETALYAGLPAAVWTRAGCSQRCPAAGANRADSTGKVREEPADPCTGLEFRQAVDAELAKCGLADLPEVIKKMRVESATASGHCGEQLVLLWDDATRKLPGDGPALTPPQHTPPGGRQR